MSAHNKRGTNSKGSMIIDRSQSSPSLRSPSKRKCRSLPHYRRSSTLCKEVVFNEIVAILQVEASNELSDAEWDTVWYSRGDLDRFRRRDQKLWASVNDAPDSDKEILINIYGLETPASRKLRHDRIRDCQLAVLIEQEKQWNDDCARPEMIAKQSRRISLKSLVGAQRRGADVAAEVLDQVVRELRANDRNRLIRTPSAAVQERRRSSKSAARLHRSEHATSTNKSSKDSSSHHRPSVQQRTSSSGRRSSTMRSGSERKTGSKRAERTSYATGGAGNERAEHSNAIVGGSERAERTVTTGGGSERAEKTFTNAGGGSQERVERSQGTERTNTNADGSQQLSVRSLPRRSSHAKWTHVIPVDSQMRVPSRK